MAADVLTLVPATANGKEGALKALDHMRDLVKSGEVACLVVTGIGREDNLHMVIGGSGKSKTQLVGALHTAAFSYMRMFVG